MTFLLFLILFALLTIPHEFGHFIFAKMFGVKVYEYAIGFGPKIFGYKGKETSFALRLIPIGGFVKMAGVDDLNTEDLNIEPEEKIPEDRKFYNKPAWQRFFILFAGSLMNFVIAILLFVSIFLIGIPEPVPIVDKVLSDKPASVAGFLPGDKILYINGVKIEKTSDAVEIITNSIKSPQDKKTITVIVQRGEEEVTLQVTPEWSEDRKGGVIGVSFKTIPKKYSLIDSIRNGISEFFNTLLLIFLLIKALFSGAQGVVVSGPVGIAKMTGEVASLGMVYFLNFAALFSAQLGIFNLLPIPALDGGRILFIIIEKIRGKRIETRKEETVHWIGLLVLLFFMLIITIFDILR
ncbi:MAG TPA: RIP metalloprotease RseP [Dictyoglomaceae bacterium]|nr:RIP metalloprotease RseP [Dictyoglomaceae bacterium]